MLASAVFPMSAIEWIDNGNLKWFKYVFRNKQADYSTLKNNSSSFDIILLLTVFVLEANFIDV
jgi:hypothetical protein